MTTRPPKAAKVPNVTTRARHRENRRILYDSDVNIGRFLDNAQNRNLRLVSKGFNQAFLDNLECANAQELQAMHKEPEPCRNTARVVYSKGMGMQRAIMCAIMSVDQKLNVYVDQDVLAEFSESVKCFDQHYALELTLLYPRAQQGPPPRPNLRCAGGFRALKVASASNGALEDQEGVQVVRFTGNTHVPSFAFDGNESLMEILGVNTITTVGLHAFFMCKALTEFGDMSKLKTIGKRAFWGTLLTQLGDMPSLTTIGERAFTYTLLKQLGDMPELTEIGDGAFIHTPLQQLGDLKSLTKIGENAFHGTALTQLGDMRRLTTISNRAFKDTPLEKLGHMPLLTTIGKGAFEDCEQLETVHLPKALKYVEKDAFFKCPLGHLTVEPGINFECRCANLTNMLRGKHNIQVEVGPIDVLGSLGDVSARVRSRPPLRTNG